MKISKMANMIPQSATSERTLLCHALRQLNGVFIARRGSLPLVEPLCQCERKLPNT